MEPLLNEFDYSTFLAPSVIAVRVIIAMICGAIVGLDREMASHAAGLRTHILVSLTAAVIAILAIEIIHMPTFADESIRIDPIRLIEALTSGVAFLAAGMIVFARGRVRGLTTGAGMWLAGAVGLACGLGLWLIAGIATLGAIVVLALLHRLEPGSKSRERPSSPDAGNGETQ
ncbi:MgtC/SapB family protein [Rhizobium sp. NRK18]|uniref:MgtC/SapB family protein n=1 Tax=Rhizobium sp. NRK18 TaxID=2964667 RepID=UPI0021C3998E|nr:MgtC/SapB family protein [Rhizobium sp. NRK18]MCQ2005284.1 MgtC/SapB family protein [Rhizobium sp. NRK18]